MIHSMTGYGRVVTDIPGKKITIEIKTLNSKQFDLSVRVPSYYREKELEIRNKLAHTLKRGKIDFSMYVELIDEQSNTSINEAIYKGYYKQLEQIYKSMDKPMPHEATVDILRLPDVLSAEHAELDEKEWAQINAIIDQAVANCNSYRLQEGEAMYIDLKSRVNNIEALRKEIEPIEKERIQSVKERIRAKLDEFIDPEKIDENRFEQELIHFLDKLDVNEEMVRLSNHCEYFLQTLDEDEANGKKLGFISQEIGREINTPWFKSKRSSHAKTSSTYEGSIGKN
jgi:uncharacterized protein (TIGR00255 family)